MRLDSFAAKVSSLGLRRYVRDYAQPALVFVSRRLADTEVGERTPDSRWLQIVAPRATRRLTVADLTPSQPLTPAPQRAGTFVFVKKTRRNPFKEMITLGRDAVSDIILSQDTVSRCHAFLQQQDSRWWLVDRGSKNGTRVGSTVLVAGKPHRLEEGVQIALGLEVSVLFFTPKAFWHYLKTEAARAASTAARVRSTL